MTLANHKARRKLWANAVGHWKPYGQVLNLACGQDKVAGWWNVDRCEPADVLHDLHKFPWPIPDGSFDSVIADQYLEHVPHHINGQDGLEATLGEIARVTKPGGRLLVGVPYWRHESHWAHPEHYRGYGWGSFDYAPKPWRLVWRGRSRRLRLLGLDSAYHGPKHLGFAPNIGPTEGFLFVLERGQ